MKMTGLVKTSLLMVIIVVTLGGQLSEAKISCYTGIYSNYTTNYACNFCESITYYENGKMYTLGVCNVSTTCTNGTVTSHGYQATTTCCYTNNCNTLTAPVTSSVTCYNGSYESTNTVTGCYSCETIQYTANDVLNYVGQCLSGSCTAGTTTYKGNSAVASCCYYDNCNTVSAPVSGPTVPTTFSCYRKSAEGSAITTSGAVCTSCQTIVATIDDVSYTSKACCEATSDCVAGSYTHDGSSGTSYLCYSNLCNGSRSIRTGSCWLIYAVLVVVLSAVVQPIKGL